MIGNRGILIIASRITPDGDDFHEEILVHETALIPVCPGWFTALIPAVHLVGGMHIQCNSEDFLLVDRIEILDDSGSP